VTAGSVAVRLSLKDMMVSRVMYPALCTSIRFDTARESGALVHNYPYAEARRRHTDAACQYVFGQTLSEERVNAAIPGACQRQRGQRQRYGPPGPGPRVCGAPAKNIAGIIGTAARPRRSPGGC
jgi:hypothetical protein